MFIVTRRGKYEANATTASINHIVTPAESYTSPRMFDVTALQKFCLAVILQPRPGTYFADLRHVCIFVAEHVNVRVRVEMLTDDAFLLYFVEEHPFMPLQAVLSEQMQP